MDALFGIQVAAGAIPAVLTILAVSVMSKYTLTDAKYAEILKEIQERRTKTVGAAEAADTSTTADASTTTETGLPVGAGTTAGH